MPNEQLTSSISDLERFVRLFRVVGKSVAGLLLLELGWTGVAALATRFTASAAGGAPYLELPWLGHPGIALSVVWAIGTVVALGFWLLYSRLWVYLAGILFVLLKPIANVVFVLILALLILLDFGTAPLTRFLHRRAKARRAASELTQLRERFRSQGVADPDRVISDLARRSPKTYGPQACQARAAQGVRAWHQPFLLLAALVGEAFLTPLHSPLRVGLAPFGRRSNDRDAIVARVATAEFALAAAAIPALLASVPESRRIRVILVPSALIVSNRWMASRLRWLLNLDVLVWGWERDDPYAASAFITSVAGHAPAHRHADDDDREPDTELFPSRVLDGAPPLHLTALRNPDATEVHCLVVLAVLEGLRARAAEKVNGFFHRWDRVGRHAPKLVEALAEYLATSILPYLARDEREKSSVPTVSVATVRVVAAWLGTQLSNRLETDGLSGPDDWRVRRLTRLTDDCLRIAPSSDLWFGRGALACLALDADTAMAAFDEAVRLDTLRDDVRPLPAQAMAQVALDLDLDLLASKAAWARFAAYAARAAGISSLTREALAQAVLNSAAHEEAHRGAGAVPFGLRIAELRLGISEVASLRAHENLGEPAVAGEVAGEMAPTTQIGRRRKPAS